jgi:hypothetical protein
VLSENEQEEWEFRKSMNPNASEHNHEMMTPEEMVKAWPAEVNEMIIQLARQRLQTHEIREAVKHQFPDISWNERRFYNRLTEERKRIRQRGVVERSQRLLLLSARLCSVVANHEEWAFAVESDLQRMFENFCQLARLTPENINTLVDLQADMIQMDTDRLVSNTHRLSICGIHSDPDEEMMGSPAKKRRSFATRSSNSNDTTVVHKSGGTGAPETQKGIQMVHVPSYTIQVRSLLNRSNSESSVSSIRRVYTESPFLDNQHHHHQQQQQQVQQQQAFGSTSSFFSLASPTSSASSSSSMPFQQRHPMAHTQQSTARVTSPQQSIHSPNEFMMSQSYQTQHPSQQQQQGDSYAISVSTTTTSIAPTVSTSNSNTGINYNMQTTFSPYTIPTSAFTTPPEQLPFGFDSVMGNRLTSSSNNNNDQFFSQVKEDPTHVEQQQQAMLRQQQEYEQRMHRNFSQQQQQHQQQSGGYSLPMIRANEDASEEPHWS